MINFMGFCAIIFVLSVFLQIAVLDLLNEIFKRLERVEIDAEHARLATSAAERAALVCFTKVKELQEKLEAEP